MEEPIGLLSRSFIRLRTPGSWSAGASLPAQELLSICNQRFAIRISAWGTLTFLTIVWGAHVLKAGMPEDKKKLARIPLPPREEEPAQEYADIPALAASTNTSERLMAQVPPSRRDPWIVPLASLVLAFSAISLIVECLVAFS
jgi:hypothetical protein